MDIKYLLLIINVFFLISCGNKKKLDNECDKVIAIVNEKRIYLSQIDSLASFQLYDIRKNALKLFLSRYIIENEAEKNNITVDSFINLNIINSISISEDEVNKYNENQNFKSDYVKNNVIDSLKIINQLYARKRKEIFDSLIIKLKPSYDIQTFLIHPSFNTQILKSLYSYDKGNTNSETIIYVIHSYNCSSCKSAELKLKLLYEKFHRKVNFRYIFYDDYIDKSAMACDAAAVQDKHWEMHDLLINYSGEINDSILNIFVIKLELNREKFLTDINNKDFLKKHLYNRDVLNSNGIYSVPTFIVNNIIVDNIDYLEDVILWELNRQ